MGDQDMPDNFIATFQQMFNNLKSDMDNNFTELKKSIECYQNKTNDQSVAISGIIKDIENIEKRLIDNFDQHKDFYNNFKQLDRLVYKMIGGIIFAGAAVGVIIKLIGAM